MTINVRMWRKLSMRMNHKLFVYIISLPELAWKKCKQTGLWFILVDDFRCHPLNIIKCSKEASAYIRHLALDNILGVKRYFDNTEPGVVITLHISRDNYEMIQQFSPGVTERTDSESDKELKQRHKWCSRPPVLGYKWQNNVKLSSSIIHSKI